LKDVLKLSVKNIQAIEEASIEVEGFTGIVGRSNSGKSALIRGLFAALTNKSPKGIFRYNTKESQVNLDDETRNIHIEWRKGDSINMYNVNGKEHTKVGKEPPPEIADWGFKTIKVNDETLDVQFARQHQYLFLLDKSGGFVAEFISKITKADILTGALKDCESDLRKANESIKHNDKEVEKLNQDLSKFDSLDYYHDRVKNIIEAKSDLLKQSAEIKQIEEWCKQKEVFVLEYKKLGETPDIVEFQFDISELKKIKDWSDEVEEQKNKLISARKVDVDILKVFEDYFQLLKKSNSDIPSIPKAEFNLDGIKEIQDLIEEKDSLDFDKEQIEEDLDNACSQIIELEKQMKSLEKQLGKCPLCKHDFKGFSHDHLEFNA
jgi:DNA repair ATPase RecN